MIELVRKTLQLLFIQTAFNVFDANGQELNGFGGLDLRLRLHGHQVKNPVIMVSHHLSDVPAGSTTRDQRQHDAGHEGRRFRKIQEMSRHFGEFAHGLISWRG